MFALIAGVILIIVILLVVMIYNRLITLKNRYLNSFSQINVQLKRRYDLLPNLIEIAKGYITHERNTLESVIQARNTAAKGLEQLAKNPGNPKLSQDFSLAEQKLGTALGNFNIVVEAYPELKANENMLQLSEELTSTENRIAFARQNYNDTVMDYNTYKQHFPNNFIANSFGHQQDASLLEFDDQKEITSPPKASF